MAVQARVGVHVVFIKLVARLFCFTLAVFYIPNIPFRIRSIADIRTVSSSPSTVEFHLHTIPERRAAIVVFRLHGYGARCSWAIVCTASEREPELESGNQNENGEERSIDANHKKPMCAL